jgi:DNA recombination protein RmuC
MIEVLLILLIILIVILMFLVLIKKDKKDDSGIDFLNKQLNELNRSQNEKLDRTIKELSEGLRGQDKTINEKILELNKILNDQLQRNNQSLAQQFLIAQKSSRDSSEMAVKTLKEITEKLVKLEETNKQVVSFSSQLQSLENILRNTKQRGVLGEYFLENLLQNVMTPNSYQMQYKFKNGETVDAVVFIKDKIVPIDSKFSLENYNRIIEEKDEQRREELQKSFKTDLKRRIDETSKYIRPEEGTTEFAFMFLPAEGIYYDLMINKLGALKIDTEEIMNYAFNEKRVLIVSPTSFLAYLQTVMQGLKALQIEESAKEIRKNVEQLQKHLTAHEEQLRKMGRALGTAVKAYDDTMKEFKKVDKDVLNITGAGIGIEVEEVAKPYSLLGD